VGSNVGLAWWAVMLVWLGGQQCWFGLVGSNIGLAWWQHI
jgi:hypothetical protein